MTDHHHATSRAAAPLAAIGADQSHPRHQPSRRPSQALLSASAVAVATALGDMRLSGGVHTHATQLQQPHQQQQQHRSRRASDVGHDVGHDHAHAPSVAAWGPSAALTALAVTTCPAYGATPHVLLTSMAVPLPPQLQLSLDRLRQHQQATANSHLHHQQHPASAAHQGPASAQANTYHQPLYPDLLMHHEAATFLNQYSSQAQALPHPDVGSSLHPVHWDNSTASITPDMLSSSGGGMSYDMMMSSLAAAGGVLRMSNVTRSDGGQAAHAFATITTHNASPGAASDGGAFRVCHHFQQGHCREGNRCRYMHSGGGNGSGGEFGGSIVKGTGGDGSPVKVLQQGLLNTMTGGMLPMFGFGHTGTAVHPLRTSPSYPQQQTHQQQAQHQQQQQQQVFASAGQHTGRGGLAWGASGSEAFTHRECFRGGDNFASLHTSVPVSAQQSSPHATLPASGISPVTEAGSCLFTDGALGRPVGSRGDSDGGGGSDQAGVRMEAIVSSLNPYSVPWVARGPEHAPSVWRFTDHGLPEDLNWLPT